MICEAVWNPPGLLERSQGPWTPSHCGYNLDIIEFAELLHMCVGEAARTDNSNPDFVRG